MEDYICKSAVLLIFFNKPNTFRRVFESVRKVKPPILYLVQDGPRKNEYKKDKIGIDDCRHIVDNIDWECTVYKNYAEENMSCDPRIYSGINWAFETTEQLIILEDDCVPTVDFFYFCDELLERYRLDERVQMICGTERMGINPICKDSYYFSYVAAGLGWATWRRVWNDVKKYHNMEFMNNQYLISNLSKWVNKYSTNIYKGYFRNLKALQTKYEESGGVQSWETLIALASILESRVAITPTVNLVEYIGNTENATHGSKNVKAFPRNLQKLFTNISKTYQLQLPLKHPTGMIRNIQCEELHWKVWGGGRVKRFNRKIESIVRRCCIYVVGVLIKIVKYGDAS